jgi:hypothetical protein
MPSGNNNSENDNSKNEKNKDNSENEKNKENSENETTQAEIIQDNTQAEIIQDNTQAEIIQDNTQAEIIQDNTQAKIIQDNTQAKIIQDNTQAEITQAEIIQDNTQAEIIQDNTQAEIIQDNTQAEIIQDNTQAEIIQDNTQAEPAQHEITLNQTTQTDTPELDDEVGNGYVIDVTEQANGSNQVTFDTTDPVNHIPQIEEDLKEIIEVYNDELNTDTLNVMNEIKNYASQIKCEDFHEKGSIDDYKSLFQAASNIANQSTQMDLDVDIEGFSEFGNAADELSSLFSSYILKLENINIINDLSFLRAVADSLKKIVNLSNVFARFKKTIIATSTIKIPKSAHDTKVILEGVMDEVNCAMNYINHFVNPEYQVENSELSASDKKIIDKSVETINSWNNLSEHRVSIVLANNSDVQYLTQTNINLKKQKVQLSLLTSTLRTKLSLLTRTN